MSKKVMQDSNVEKAKWSTENIELFLNLCVDEVIAGNRPGTHFNKFGWTNLVKKFNDRTGKNYDKLKLKNKWDTLKTTWKEWDALVGKETGLGWDSEKKTIQASTEWWDRKIKENSDVEKFKEEGLQYRTQMEICFKDVVDTGEHAWAPSSGVLPDGVQGSRWFQSEQPFEFDTPISNEEFVTFDALEELIETEKKSNNENDTRRKRKVSKVVTETKKTNPGLQISSSMERIADAIESRTSTESRETSLSIKSVMTIVRNLPGMVVGSDLWWKTSDLLVKQSMREMFLAQEDAEMQLQWLERKTMLHKD